MRQVDRIVEAWGAATRAVAKSPSAFLGRDKETRVFRRVRAEIEAIDSAVTITGPDYQARFNSWAIDLVWSDDDGSVAVEGKYKTMRDGAVPDNRKAALFDLYKLEQYVASGKYVAGIFLWLTDHPSYRSVATGDSADFSTHDGRQYRAGTPLRASRARNTMPIPLVLNADYTFKWQVVDAVGGWHSLAIRVGNTQPNKALEPTARTGVG